jgi:hypothetical protein
MKNIILTIALTCCLGVGMMSCSTLGDFFGEDTVLTTADQLEEGQKGAIIPFDQLPEDVKAKIPEGTSLVMATKDQLVDDAAYVAVGGVSDGEDMGGLIDAVFGVAGTFIPGLAAWEGIVTMFSQRKRKHYVRALKSLVPTDKNMDLGGAVGSVASALGISHSSDNSASAFEDDIHDEVV